jgi:RNA polymerase sigma factor (sigma-70 family)
MSVGTPADMARLTERIRVGEAAAEEELVARFRERVFTLALLGTRDRETARDLTQDTFIAAFAGVRDGRLADPLRLAGYICGTARNVISHHLRTLAQRREETVDIDLPGPDDPERGVAAAEEAALARRAVDSLGSQDRLVLLLTLIDGLTPAEIAVRLQLRPDAVRQRKARAIARVRAVVERLSRS